MAGEAKNLLTRTLATAPRDEMQLYVVYNGRDYRIQLDTLLSLITKARLGIELVDNVPDMDKPISTAMANALQSKANADSVVTKVEWELFIQQFSGMMTPAELNLIIQNLQAAISSKTTAQETATAINTALAPISLALVQMQGDISTLKQAAGSYATKVELQAAIDHFTTEVARLDTALSQYIISNDNRVQALEQRVKYLEDNGLQFGPNQW